MGGSRFQVRSKAKDAPGATMAVLLAMLEGQSPLGLGGHFEWQGTTCLLPNPLASHLSPACVLQANCRAWGLFHAVLMRQTLCFYQDRRDSSKVWGGRAGGGAPEGAGRGVGGLAVGCPRPRGRGGQRLPTLLMLWVFPVLQSSVVALPLNLSGAVCTPDTEYTKKTNCFRLQ